MPLNLNQVNIAGTLTRDAEVKFTPKGKAVASFSLAINHVWRNEAGEKQEDVTFVDCEAWGRTAEIIGEHTSKGHTIYISGHLKLDQWDDKETGKKRSRLKVVADKFEFVSTPKNSGGEGQSKPAGRAPAPHHRKPEPDPDLDMDGQEIPF